MENWIAALPRADVAALRDELLDLTRTDPRSVAVSLAALVETIAAYIDANCTDEAAALKAADHIAEGLKTTLRAWYEAREGEPPEPCLHRKPRPPGEGLQ